MTKKDPKDILKEIKSQIDGVSPEDISFNDLRKKSINKSKKIKKKDNKNSSTGISNKEGFSLSLSETSFCDYRDIRSKRRLTKKNNLEEWGAFDFFMFAEKLYIDRYKKRWDLKIAGNSLEINRIRDMFYDYFGFCCNLIMKDYISYFFDNYMEDCINKFGVFYFKHMRKDWIVEDFVKHYSFRERFSTYVNDKKVKDGKKLELTRDAINQAFSMGDTTLVGNYGVVIALNFLLKSKKMNKSDSIKIVVDACKDMAERNLIDVVKRSTEFYSPYPSNLLFTSPQLIFNKISKGISIDVDFSDNDKMIFLQKGE